MEPKDAVISIIFDMYIGGLLQDCGSSSVRVHNEVTAVLREAIDMKFCWNVMWNKVWLHIFIIRPQQVWFSY